jgi:uncharacterized damage-inducible protein DinB
MQPSLSRMTEDTVLNTTIHEPSMTAGEVEMLQFSLARARAQFAWKVGGLDAAGLRQPHPPSTITLGGLIKHVAWCEDQLTAAFVTGEPVDPSWRGTRNGEEWRLRAEDSPEALYAQWRDAADRSRTAWETVLADGSLDEPSTFTTPAGEHPNLRRALIDLIEHYIRHTGHADLIREAVDGLVGEDPPQS